MSTKRSPWANHANGTSVPVSSSIGWWSRSSKYWPCRRRLPPGSADRHRPVSSVMSIIHECRHFRRQFRIERQHVLIRNQHPAPPCERERHRHAGMGRPREWRAGVDRADAFRLGHIGDVENDGATVPSSWYRADRPCGSGDGSGVRDPSRSASRRQLSIVLASTSVQSPQAVPGP